VLFDDGRSPNERVAIERVCNGVVRPEGYTDSRGDFGFHVGAQSAATFFDASVGFDRPSTDTRTAAWQAGLSDRDLAGCELRARVPGYMSDSITLGFRRALDNPFIGTIYLHPLTKDEDFLLSTTTVRKDAAALIAAHVEEARIAANSGKWEDVVRHTSEIFRLNPFGDAEFYFYSAVAHHYLQNAPLAENHARKAALLDVRHQNPKILHVLAVILAGRGAYTEAAENLRLYLQLLPEAPEAAAVREQLASFERAARGSSLGVKWIHGSDPCSANTDVPFQVYQHDDDTFILRENKCIHYEGPFIYLLFGTEKVFMQDTGAAPPANSGIAFPIRETVQKVIKEWSDRHGRPAPQLIVTHSHAHGDHTGGDSQFAGQPNTSVAGTKLDDVQAFFGFRDWPNQSVTMDLGGRILDIIPIPGHEATSLAVYDRKSRLLLTGDSFYPGRLYIRDWPAYKASTERLVSFMKTHEVVHVLGTHIEMSNKDGVDYPVRTTFQPEEHELELSPAHLLELHEALSNMKDSPVRETHKDFIIYPR
jgi:glyoxylase-like metal-dependent hydrolase (beta-lactamase superfamily II)